ncbi:hypothetical protein [Streptomyces sp. t99]|uniref:hypothetical protein n=1 Tax=Streptomyces sp. t99 TaxID=1828172 RepID=UPI00211D47E7|nr:hypothetical protein [Streptomyces sp. t99]
MATVRYLVGDPPVKSSVNLDHREQRNRTAQIAVISQDLSGQSRAESDGDGCGCDGAEEDVAALVVAGGDCSCGLESIDCSLDGIAFLVPLFVEAGGPCAA